MQDLLQDVGQLYTSGLTGAWNDGIIVDLTTLLRRKRRITATGSTLSTARATSGTITARL